MAEAFDIAIFANSLHLLDERAKADSLAGIRRVLRPGGLLAVNTAFYEGVAPDESRPFYSRWIRMRVLAPGLALLSPNLSTDLRARSPVASTWSKFNSALESWLEKQLIAA